MNKIPILIILSGLIYVFYSPPVVQMQSNSAVPKTQPTIDVSNDPRVGWLKKNALTIRSIDPSDTEFSDLMPLKKAIGDARVVMLGEATHTDGNTYLAKGRLIKFLHEKMGFDVIAFESGFYDLSRAWQDIQAGEDVTKAGNTSPNEEFRPIIEYIKGQSKSKNPLEITGFDSQLTGPQTRYSLVSDLRDFFKDVGVQTEALDEGSSFATQLVLSGLVGRYTAPDQAFIDTLVGLRKQVAAKTGKPQSAKIAFGIQLLESIEANAKMWRLMAEAEEKNRRREPPTAPAATPSMCRTLATFPRLPPTANPRAH